jgi:RimJ/RimL family protein N-acetyltransferase
MFDLPELSWNLQVRSRKPDPLAADIVHVREDRRNGAGLAGRFGSPGGRVKMFDKNLIYAVIGGKGPDCGLVEVEYEPRGLSGPNEFCPDGRLCGEDGPNAARTHQRSGVYVSLLSIIMAGINQALIELPMPIRTARLTIRSKQVGDGAITSAAVAETWEELNRWMRWAEDREAFTAELMEIRNRQVMASILLRQTIEFIGIETHTGKAVVWCGFHDIDWEARQCDTGYWVRKTAQCQGLATETANAMLRYAFGALEMQRVGLTHSSGNEPSRRIAERLGFTFEGIQRRANMLPGGKFADRYCYARFDVAGLPDLEMTWGGPSSPTSAA